MRWMFRRNFERTLKMIFRALNCIISRCQYCKEKDPWSGGTDPLAQQEVWFHVTGTVYSDAGGDRSYYSAGALDHADGNTAVCEVAEGCAGVPDECKSFLCAD